MALSRREFLAASGSLALTGTINRSLAAIEPIKRPSNRADIKLSLAAYSFRDFLDLKKPTMTLFDFIDLAAGLPLDAVELTSYYFAEQSEAYLSRLKSHAASKKLAISGVPVSNNFCQADDARRNKDIQHVKDWTARAAFLGAKTVRIFAGSIDKGETLAQAQKRVVAAMEDCCSVAEKLGIALALENHGGITDTPEHLLDLIKPVNSPALGVNVDTGNFRTADPYADIAKIIPYGVVSQIKTEVFPGGKREDADFARLIKIFKDGNFHGYAALEYEAAEDPRVAVTRAIKQLRALIG